MLRTLLFLLIICINTPLFGANYLIYIPQDYRQENMRASCVFASVTNCMRNANLWDEAEAFWQKYRGCPWGENPGGLRNKLDKFGVGYKQITNGDEKFLLSALSCGRCVAVSWGGKHMVNLAGKIDGNAYIVDNERTGHYIVQPWSKFLSGWRRCGGWAVVITSGMVTRPIDRKNLDGLQI